MPISWLLKVIQLPPLLALTARVPKNPGPSATKEAPGTPAKSEYSETTKLAPELTPPKTETK